MKERSRGEGGGEGEGRQAGYSCRVQTREKEKGFDQGEAQAGSAVWATCPADWTIADEETRAQARVMCNA